MIDDGRLNADPFEKSSGGGAGGGFVAVSGPPEAAVNLAQFGGVRFGEIVGQGGEKQHGSIVAFASVALGDSSGVIDDMHGVDADVAFGMPVGVLRDFEKALDFGEVNQPSAGAKISGDASGM